MITLATAARILRQLRHDRRTVGLLIVVPAALLALLYFMYDGAPAFDRVALVMLGVFPFVIMFLVTSIAMLRERTSGTLERLLTTPLRKLDLLFGYGLAFGLAGAVQALVAVAAAHWLFGLETPAGSVLVAVVDAVLGMALGLLCSAFARTEFQAVQFIPVVVAPQLFLCGLFVPRDEMAGWLQAVSDVLPLTYAVKALAAATVWRDLAVVAGAAVLALILAAATLRRRTG
ncbi:ABC transporter permease [Winogradskya humida]|uniref:Transport permease protein n=1 Tax=Winogradskya humida TaxID=113566 RepID=A0ABQ3ZFN6_9ACTN|nr:ABC transporter permease [Actinoplanes humidus]GIE17339.1 transport permease protein [Actinoplanes humidus]